MLRFLICGLAAAAVLVSGCGSDRRPASTATSSPTQLGHGLSAVLPDGWQAATTSLTPHLIDPREEMSVGTFPLSYQRGACAQFPSGTLEQLRPTDAFVTIQERGVHPGSTWPDFPPRPAHFGPDLGGASEVEQCVPDRRFSDHWFNFTDGDRHFDVLVVFGLEASPAVQQQAWAILDSLKVDPQVRPTWEASP